MMLGLWLYLRMLSDKYSSDATLEFYEYEKDRFNDSLCFIRLLIGCYYVGTKKFYPHDLTSCCFCYMGRGALMEERHLTFHIPRMENGFTLMLYSMVLKLV